MNQVDIGLVYPVSADEQEDWEVLRDKNGKT